MRTRIQAYVLSLFVLRGLVWISACAKNAVANFECNDGGVWCWNMISGSTERETGSLNSTQMRRVKSRHSEWTFVENKLLGK